MTPWALNQGIRFGMGLGVMIVAALIRPEFYYKIATPFICSRSFCFLSLMSPDIPAWAPSAG